MNATSVKLYLVNLRRLAEALEFGRPSLFAKAAERKAALMSRPKRNYTSVRTVQATAKTPAAEEKLSRNSAVVRNRRLVEPATMRPQVLSSVTQSPSSFEPTKVALKMVPMVLDQTEVSAPELAFSHLPDPNYSGKLLDMSRLAKALQCDLVTELGQQKTKKPLRTEPFFLRCQRF